MSCWTACTQGSRDQTVVRPSSPAVNDLLTTEGARQRVRVENAAPARREHRSDRGVGDIIRERHQPARQTRRNRRTRRRLYRDHVLNPTSAGCYQLLRCRHSIHSVAVSPSPSMASSSLKSVSSSECAATVIRARSRSSLVLSTVVSLFLRSVATRPFMNGESCIGRLETTPLTTSLCGGDGATFRVRHPHGGCDVSARQTPGTVTISGSLRHFGLAPLVRRHAVDRPAQLSVIHDIRFGEINTELPRALDPLRLVHFVVDRSHLVLPMDRGPSPSTWFAPFRIPNEAPAAVGSIMFY